jgi:type IV pilus assembly protein PilE
MNAGTRMPRGWTLVELMMAALVLAVLAMIAVPSYRGQLHRAHRSDARVALLALGTAQERFHLLCNAFAGTLSPTGPPDCPTGRMQGSTTSPQGHYRLTITAADTDGWRAEAVPAGPPQTEDRRCQWFGLESSGARSARDDDGADRRVECWGG